MGGVRLHEGVSVEIGLDARLVSLFREGMEEGEE